MYDYYFWTSQGPGHVNSLSYLTSAQPRPFFRFRLHQPLGEAQLRTWAHLDSIHINTNHGGR